MFGVFECLGAANALEVPFARMDPLMCVDQPGSDGRFEVALGAAVEFHVDGMRTPEVSVERVPGAKALGRRRAVGANDIVGVVAASVIGERVGGFE